jgi:hypothetical protein
MVTWAFVQTYPGIRCEMISAFRTAFLVMFDNSTTSEPLTIKKHAMILSSPLCFSVCYDQWHKCLIQQGAHRVYALILIVTSIEARCPRERSSLDLTPRPLPAVGISSYLIQLPLHIAVIYERGACSSRLHGCVIRRIATTCEACGARHGQNEGSEFWLGQLWFHADSRDVL